MYVVHAAAEAVPFVKVGGLGDVLGGLPKAQARAGLRPVVALPRYAKLKAEMDLEGEVSYPFAGGESRARVWSAEHAGVGFRFFEVDPGWEGPYQSPEAERYLRFSLALAAWLEGENHDLLHAHDWHAAYAVRLSEKPAVFTIHNLAFQGVLEPGEFTRLTGQEPDASLLHEGRVNLMKGALLAAARVSTVSPNYAREILTPEYGMGLEGVLQSISGKLRGILNGLDTEYWNPATDPYLPHRYDREHLRKKRLCRAAMLAPLGLDPGLFTIGAVTRLTWQKGFDLVLQALPELLDSGTNFVLLGTGEKELEEGFAEMARRYPRRVAFFAEFNEPWAHKIYGGSEAFLMPSRFEPCGLSQMIAMRYGTPPVARRTGGLADTIEDGVTGVLFDEASPKAILAAVERLREMDCLELARAGMSRDFSWDRRAGEYLELYEEALSG
ncbi:glycogen synthase [Oceanithermus sp.]